MNELNELLKKFRSQINNNVPEYAYYAGYIESLFLSVMTEEQISLLANHFRSVTSHE